MTSAWATDKHCLPGLRNRYKEPWGAPGVHGGWYLHASLHPFSSHQSPRNFPQRGRRTQGTCFEFSNLILQVIKCLCFGWVLLQFTHSTPSPVSRVNSNIWWLWHTKNFYILTVRYIVHRNGLTSPEGCFQPQSIILQQRLYLSQDFRDDSGRVWRRKMILKSLQV